MERPDPDRAIRVLLFEDDELVLQQLLETYLRNEGFDVRSSNDVEDVVVIASDWAPDVALVDLYVDDVPWFAAAKDIKTVSPATKVLAFTKSMHAVDARSALGRDGRSGGFDGYITKRTSPQSIVAAVHEAIEGAYPVDPQITRDLLVGLDVDLDPIEIRFLEAKQRGLEGQALREALPRNHGNLLSERQIGRYAASVRTKLGASTTEQALAEAIRRRLIRLGGSAGRPAGNESH